ncbi:hypothetical protein BKA56DRAFT_485948 [Ilyonectria sp. MPI-CAGE-AT-0026]|nr:hypothetical protein BKA56DRAFT_485948 [Ilyonectria sp. MPI-CAGE-AT-0026]
MDPSSCGRTPATVSDSKSSRDDRTFRVRGVPITWDTDRLKSFLTEHDNAACPVIKSLAYEIGGRSSTATVTFQTVPLALQKKTWYILLPKADENGPDRYLALSDDFLGITTLYAPSPDDHKVDVIALPGLGGHAFSSFKERGSDYMWLRDALPYDITHNNDDTPIARVMTYGYESRVSQSKSIQNLEDLATSFHTALIALARAPTIKPIILIAHSLGGLIVKQALISLSKSTAEDDTKLVKAVYGIVFFGVPHEGMDTSSLIPLVGDGPNRFLIESISRINSQLLSIQQREFHTALGSNGHSEVFCFYETLESPTAHQDAHGEWTITGPTSVLVTKSSATHCRPWESGPEHICAIARTHFDMVRFKPQDHEYDNARERLDSLAQRAISKRRPARASMQCM